MIESITTALGTITGLGLALSPFVSVAVTMVRGAIGADPRRNTLLPLVGICVGIFVAALVLMYLEQPMTVKNIATVILTGFWAYAVSVGLHSHAKAARAEK